MVLRPYAEFAASTVTALRQVQVAYEKAPGARQSTEGVL